ncbi:MAG TPA: hypothetical protein VKR30_10090 [Candidatus Limnocylindrales bacterium]|nr:hypothetical protein [Candidatus Limnocylindrales bacterium]
MQRLRAFLFGVALLLAACQSSPATPAPTGVASGQPSAAASAAPTETASPSPTDVSQAFTAQIVAATKGSMKLTGQLQLGEQIGDVSGSLTYVGGDSDQLTTITLAGVTSSTHSIHVGGFGYTQIGDGPWFQDAVAPKVGQDMFSVLKGLSSLVDKGVEQHDGVAAHRIELAPGAALPAAAFGLTDPKIVNPTITLVFYADDTGKPLAMVVTATWSQTVAGQAVPVTMTLDFTFTQIGGTLTVAIPDHVWQTYTSKRFHYKLSYPDDWDLYLKDKHFDYFDSPSITYVAVERFKSSGIALNIWAQVAIAYDKSHYHGTGISNVAFKLAGVSGRLITAYLTVSGKKVVTYEVIAIKGGYLYDVVWESPKGNEATDLGTFKEMLATFAYA